MSRLERFSAWLENTSDWLSPIVVKEVRQIVRGREFMYSFGASLLAGLAVAFFGAADALTDTGTSGGWTFGALMACLMLLGLAVVPLGAFAALRIERMEQTLELITLTALTPRRVVIGKLLAQAVKLVTLFAAMAPFIAMSFLLGGIDFVTILVSLAILFMWSLWISSASLFLSALLKSRAMAALVFGGVGILLLVLFVLFRGLYFYASRGSLLFSASVAGIGPMGSEPWWALAIMTSMCLATMINLVLLAENRLALATENKVTPLRIGFLVQFLLILGWALSFINEPGTVRLAAGGTLGVAGGLHLALVATFTVTEDLLQPRLARRRASPSRWSWLHVVLRPGGGYGALYVLAQMALLLVAARLLQAPLYDTWALGICGYICLFTGVPTFVYRALRPTRAASLKLRVTVLILIPASLLLPDAVHYLLWQPDTLSLTYSARHLFNPFRTLANWDLVESAHWLMLPLALGLAGLLSYLALIHMGISMNAEVAPTDPEGSAAEAGEPGSADVLY